MKARNLNVTLTIHESFSPRASEGEHGVWSLSLKGELDELNGTSVEVNAGGWFPVLTGKGDFDFSLEMGDTVIIDIPSGTLTGRVTGFSGQEMGGTCGRLHLGDATWDGWGGGPLQCALGYVQVGSGGVVESSAWPTPLRLSEYQAARQIVAVISESERLSPEEKRAAMTAAVALMRGFGSEGPRLSAPEPVDADTLAKMASIDEGDEEIDPYADFEEVAAA